MEEKLRNLSQNIANNTGDNAHQPEETPPPEPEETHEEKAPEEGTHDEPLMDEAEENVPEPETPEQTEEKSDASLDAEDDFGKAPQETVSDSSSAKILTMDADEPQESPTRTKKYSPEVEAALNRLNSDDSSINFDTEPLSTEPKQQSHAGRILLAILLILALAAATVCVLVEQNIIDNPLDLIIKKDTSSQVEPATNQPTINTPPEPAPDNETTTSIDELVEAVKTPGNTTEEQ